MDERTNSVVYPWRRVDRGELPPRNEPVLCAWKFGPKWHYAVAKFTGKRWLDIIPETANEEYQTPVYWQKIESPDSASTVTTEKL